MSVAACRAAGADPLAYLTAPGAVLTAEGKAILRRLQATPNARAAALRIDLAAVNAYARRAGIPPAECLNAEIERLEQLARDLNIMAGLPPEGAPAGGPAQSSAAEKPVDPLLEKDRATARRFGLDL
jgi:hypothetical protein